MLLFVIFGFVFLSLPVAFSISRASTPYWMAPEVILGSSYTSAVDMWSFGILCMELAGALFS
jgi:serine/threonine protein kinase